MVGPLKGGTHKKKYLLVMVDKFTKCIEAKPVKTVESGPVIDFISGVVHRYDVPHSILTKCDRYGVVHRFGAKCDPVPPNIFLERLFKPSVVWEGDTGNNSPDPATMPDTEHSNTIGGSATEITPSGHVIMAVIAPWTKPFLAYLTRQELTEDQNEARCIVRRSKAYKVHEG